MGEPWPESYVDTQTFKGRMGFRPMLTGGCHCGAVRYEAAGEPMERALCHCTDCRKTTRAPALAWFTVATGDFHFTRGDAGVATPRAQPGRAVLLRRCGTQLTFTHAATTEDRLDVTTASLDDPGAVPPREHIWTRSRIAWMTGLDAPARTQHGGPALRVGRRGQPPQVDSDGQGSGSWSN